MKSVLTWLQEDGVITKSSSDGLHCKYKIRLLERIAELICVNGGSTVVTVWGSVQFGMGPYGRMGLTMTEALELINLGGMLQGFLLCEDNEEIRKKTLFAIKSEIERTIKEGFDPEKGKIEKRGLIVVCNEHEMAQMVANVKVVEAGIRSDRKDSGKKYKHRLGM